MRNTCFLLLFFSNPLIAQQSNQISVMGGVEFHAPYFTGLFEPYATAWNAGLSYSSPLKKTTRWIKEMGVSAGIAEYNGPSKYIEDFDTMPAQPSSGSIENPGYIRHEVVYYSKQTFLRLHIAANYALAEGEKFSFFAGIGVVSDITVSYWERGRSLLSPYAENPDLPVVYGDFYNSGTDNISNVERVDFLIQPNLKMDYAMTDKLSLNLRITYFQSIFHGGKFITQLNTGISYRW